MEYYQRFEWCMMIFWEVLIGKNCQMASHYVFYKSSIVFDTIGQDSIKKLSEKCPRQRFETHTHILTRIRLNAILTLATKRLMIINKDNLYLYLQAF